MLNVSYYSNINPVYFKNISSLDYLLILKKHKCTDQEKETIQGLIFKYDIPNEVLNTTLHYLINFKRKKIEDEALEELTSILVNKKIKTAEEAILYFERKEEEYENERMTKRESKINKAYVSEEKRELMKVNGLLDATTSSFKKRCSIEQKRELVDVMNKMIKSAFYESQNQ